MKVEDAIVIVKELAADNSLSEQEVRDDPFTLVPIALEQDRALDWCNLYSHTDCNTDWFEGFIPELIESLSLALELARDNIYVDDFEDGECVESEACDVIEDHVVNVLSNFSPNLAT